MCEEFEKQPTKIQEKWETVFAFIIAFFVLGFSLTFLAFGMLIEDIQSETIVFGFLLGSISLVALIEIINIFRQADRKGYVERPVPK